MFRRRPEEIMAEQEFTTESLAEYDGKEGRPAYIAFEGKVYDVTSSGMWEDGQHEGEHYAGTDLTADMDFAPHLADALEGFTVVGEFVE
jgi:predicted heme/steroid binding protein